MKVLINTRSLEFKGGVVNFYKILSLNSLGNVDYFIYSKENVKFKLLFLINSYFRFFKVITKYDIIHLNPSLTGIAIWRDLVFLILAKARNKKVVVFIHGWNYKLEDKIKKSRILNRIFLRYEKTDAFFVSGTVFKKEIISMGISPDKMFYLETMIADERYIADFSVEERVQKYMNNNTHVKFLFISRITAGKGMKLAIDIFNIVQNKHKRKMKLVIAGDGDKLEETKQYVKENNILNVEFVGYIKNKEKHDLLKDCDITLFPTMYGEGLPNTVLEGMLYGMPIISRINAGIPDWIKNNENGFITESTNADDFVPFIEKIINDKALFAKIARNNHKLAKENFTKKIITKRFLEHYEEVYNMK